MNDSNITIFIIVVVICTALCAMHCSAFVDAKQHDEEDAGTDDICIGICADSPIRDGGTVCTDECDSDSYVDTEEKPTDDFDDLDSSNDTGSNDDSAADDTEETDPQDTDDTETEDEGYEDTDDTNPEDTDNDSDINTDINTDIDTEDGIVACDGVVCNQPPVNKCENGALFTYKDTGVCTNGSCYYPYQLKSCHTEQCADATTCTSACTGIECPLSITQPQHGAMCGGYVREGGELEGYTPQEFTDLSVIKIYNDRYACIDYQTHYICEPSVDRTITCSRGQGCDAKYPHGAECKYMDWDEDGFIYTEDCNDTPGSGWFINPDQDEVVGDDIDNDCDGLVDEVDDE